MKLWTDASRTRICYIFENGEVASAPLREEMPVNQAEYNALLCALRDCLQRGFFRVEVFTDSQVLAYQMTGRYKCKAANLKPLRTECYRLLAQFERWSITWVSRKDNKAGLFLDSLDKIK